MCCLFTVAWRCCDAYIIDQFVIAFLYIIASYLIGAVPFGYLAGRIKGVDLREHGSHNIGATNAVRVLGKSLGFPVFVFDFMKGFLPVFCWAHFSSFLQGPGSSAWMSETVLVLVCLATIVGHTYTCYLQFKGGKGVATTAGVLMALSPQVFGIAIVVWLVVFLTTRYVSLASIVAAVAMVVSGLYCYGFFALGGLVWRPDAIVIIFLLLVAILVIAKHRSNISRLLKGTEPKAFSRK